MKPRPSSPLRSFSLLSSLVLSLVLISACGGSDSGGTTPTTGPEPVGRVEVTPNSLTLTVGESGQLNAQPQSSSGSPLSGRTVTWSSSDTGVATVSSTGSVTAVAPGAVTITATSEGRSGSAAVAVNAVPVSTVALDPTEASLQVQATTQLTARTLDASGNELTDRTVSWSSSDESVATVSSSGLVTGVAPGEATITAASEGVSATAAITVTRQEVGLTLGASSASPLKTVTVTFPVALGNPGDRLQGTLGESEVNLVVTGSVTAAFAAPDATAGSYTLRVPLGSTQVGVAAFQLLPAPAVDPQTVTTDALSKLDELATGLTLEISIGALDSLGIVQADVDATTRAIQNIRQIFDGATAEEQRRIGLTFDANPILFDTSEDGAAGIDAPAGSSGPLSLQRSQVANQQANLRSTIDLWAGKTAALLGTCRSADDSTVEGQAVLEACRPALLGLRRNSRASITAAQGSPPFMDHLTVEGKQVNLRSPQGVTARWRPSVQYLALNLLCDAFCERSQIVGDRIVPPGGDMDAAIDAFVELKQNIFLAREFLYGDGDYRYAPAYTLGARTGWAQGSDFEITPLNGAEQFCEFGTNATEVEITCSHSASTDQTFEFEVTSTWPWQSAPGRATVPYTLLVPAQTAPQLAVVNNAFGADAPGFLFIESQRSLPAVGCRRDLTLRAVGGEIEIIQVEFTSTDAIGRSVTIDVTPLAVPIRLQPGEEYSPLNGSLFFYYLEGYEPPEFGTVYKVRYNVPAEERQEVLEAEWSCNGGDYLLIERSQLVGTTYGPIDGEEGGWLQCYRDVFARNVGDQTITATGADITFRAENGGVFEQTVTYTGSTVVPDPVIAPGEVGQILDNAWFRFPFPNLVGTTWYDVEYLVNYTRADGTTFKIRDEWRCAGGPGAGGGATK